MRDVSHKSPSLREAWAEAVLNVSPGSIRLIETGQAPKGDPRPVARVAAILAAKNTPQTIPYCHPVPIDYVGVEFEMGESSILVTVHVKAVYKTGVEMEAMNAASAAALNLFDLLKPVDDEMEITSIKLLKKIGGKTEFAVPGGFSATVIVVSDRVSAGTGQDVSGEVLCEFLASQEGTVAAKVVVPDDPAQIASSIRDSATGLVVLTGGTGLGPRDNTHEAVLGMLDRRIPGIEHRLHEYGQTRFPGAMLGRPVCGLVGESVVLALPGSPGAVKDAMSALFPHIKHVFHILAGGGHDG